MTDRSTPQQTHHRPVWRAGLEKEERCVPLTEPILLTSPSPRRNAWQIYLAEHGKLLLSRAPPTGPVPDFATQSHEKRAWMIVPVCMDQHCKPGRCTLQKIAVAQCEGGTCRATCRTACWMVFDGPNTVEHHPAFVWLLEARARASTMGNRVAARYLPCIHTRS